MFSTDGTQTICATDLVYLSPGDPSPMVSLACSPTGPSGRTLYRAFPDFVSASATSASSSTVLSSSSSSVIQSSSTSSLAQSTGAGFQTNTVTPTPAPASKSKAWIAGPVIGGLAAVCGILVGFLILRRKRASGLQQSGPPPMTEQSQYPPTTGQAQYPPTECYGATLPYVPNEAEQRYYTHPSLTYGPTEMDAGNHKLMGTVELGSRY
jgi:hypothetical protein